MDWRDCEKRFVRSVEVDREQIGSIIKAAHSRLKYLRSSSVNHENVSFIVEGYYEVIKEFLTALLMSKGLKSKNHQCLITYFYRNYPEHEASAHIVSHLSYLRNRLNYYGELIDFEFYKKNTKDFEILIKTLEGLTHQSLKK